jgi:hypothetical protein
VPALRSQSGDSLTLQNACGKCAAGFFVSLVLGDGSILVGQLQTQIVTNPGSYKPMLLPPVTLL